VIKIYKSRESVVNQSNLRVLIELIMLRVSARLQKSSFQAIRCMCYTLSGFLNVLLWDINLYIIKYMTQEAQELTNFYNSTQKHLLLIISVICNFNSFITIRYIYSVM
jgi:hypothetical protein